MKHGKKYNEKAALIDPNRAYTPEEAVKVAYFEQSGITVHGSSSTRFLYNLSNEIFDGHARTGFWNIKSLAAGDYILRIYAADYAGNVASKGRDLALRLEETSAQP